MSSPWAPQPRIAPESARLLIERAHEEFVRGNAQDRRVRDVRPLVRESWRRSLDSLVDVEGLPPVALTADELERYRAAHPLASAMDMIRGLILPGEARDAGVIVAVGDAAGRLLWIEGDPALRDTVAGMGFVAGADWGEDAVGTAAPGTALRLDRSVQIRGAEHFNRRVQPWSCTAAPVHDPETGRVVGVIDVTGGDPVVTPQAQLLVDATARAVEGRLLLSRLQAPPSPARRAARAPSVVATLGVLGRDRAVLEIGGGGPQRRLELSTRHAELLLLLSLHRQGLSAARLGELVYGEPDATVTLRAEMVRLRRVLEPVAPELVPESRPYRLGAKVETDAHHVLSLLDRGAHRVALAAYVGEVLPASTAPGIVEFRDTVHATLRQALLDEAGIDVLLAYADTDAGADDEDLLRLCLRMLPARSPRRAGIVARLEAIAGA